MSEARFTVGPWRVAENSNGHQVIVEGVDGQRIASAFFRGDVLEWLGVAEANAALIAAAPDLYGACLRAEMWLSTHPEGGRICEVLRAAVEKASPSLAAK